MDTSNPAIFVNGSLLPMHLRKRVRTVIQVLVSEPGSVVGKTTDDVQIVIKGSPPPQSEPLTTFVEVIGIADTEKSIQAEIWSNFGDAAGTNSKFLFLLFTNTISHMPTPSISFASLQMVNTNSYSSEQSSNEFIDSVIG
ncbi:Replication protein A 14 kDa subunit B [Linum perenne]